MASLYRILIDKICSNVTEEFNSANKSRLALQQYSTYDFTTTYLKQKAFVIVVLTLRVATMYRLRGSIFGKFRLVFKMSINGLGHCIGLEN